MAEASKSVEELFKGQSVLTLGCCDVNPAMKLRGLRRALVAQGNSARDQRDSENQCQSPVLLFPYFFKAQAIGSKQEILFLCEAPFSKNLVGACPCAILCSER